MQQQYEEICNSSSRPGLNQKNQILKMIVIRLFSFNIRRNNEASSCQIGITKHLAVQVRLVF